LRDCQSPLSVPIRTCVPRTASYGIYRSRFHSELGRGCSDLTFERPRDEAVSVRALKRPLRWKSCDWFNTASRAWALSGYQNATWYCQGTGRLRYRLQATPRQRRCSQHFKTCHCRAYNAESDMERRPDLQSSGGSLVALCAEPFPNKSVSIAQLR